MSRQKNSILINEHELNREPVPLIQLQAKKIYRSPEKHPFGRPYDPGLTAANKKVAEKIDFASFKNFSWLFQFAQLLIEGKFGWNRVRIQIEMPCPFRTRVNLIGPLQLAIHVIQNRRIGGQKSHWEKTNKRHT